MLLRVGQNLPRENVRAFITFAHFSKDKADNEEESAEVRTSVHVSIGYLPKV